MTAETQIEIIDRLERMERMIKAMAVQKASGKKWVKTEVIRKLTGWDRSGMQKARKYGYVTHRVKDGIVEYDMNSIHPLFIK